MRFFLPFVFLFVYCLLPIADCFSQGCCSGGSGSPIAGGASAGVLLDRQMEIACNFQSINSNNFLTRRMDTARFFAKDIDTSTLFTNYNSKYLYGKIAYGFTKDFTLSVEAGYFINKTQIGLPINNSDVIKSSGIGDLIIFPRYDIYNHTEEKKRVEVTLGLGYKIPIGKHTDSTVSWYDSTAQLAHYTTAPPLVQPTNGSQDIIFYGFFFRGFPLHNFRVFANAIYIKKGWNSLGQKFGDYASVGLYAGKTFFKNVGVTLQVKGESIGVMKHAQNIDLVALYGVDIRSTGSKKILFVPQVSYSYKSFTVFALGEIPLYEYVNGVQVVKLHQFTAGVSYRFFTVHSKIPSTYQGTIYTCPMKCEGMEYKEPGKCKICGMELIGKKP